MIRSELLQLLANDNPDLRADEVEQVVDIFFEEITQRLAEGGRVELRGFGAFSTREREARQEAERREREAPQEAERREREARPEAERQEREAGRNGGSYDQQGHPHP